MNEDKHMYADLMNLLLPLLPSNIYQDVRRVQTLAWALVGLCMTQTVRLGAWAEVVDSRAQLASSRVRRFARWLHQRAIAPQQWYEPLLLQALRDWKLPKRVYVALDTTALSPFVLIRASLIYEGRAIPLAWRAILRASTKVPFKDYQPVLEQVRMLLPAHLIVTLLGSSWLCPCPTRALHLRAPVAFPSPLDRQYPSPSRRASCLFGKTVVSFSRRGTLLALRAFARAGHRSCAFGSGLS